jgi:hypothetical protein
MQSTEICLTALVRQEAQIRGAGLACARNSTAVVPSVYPKTHVETWVDVGEQSSSQKRIVGGQAHRENQSDESVIDGRAEELIRQ